jgi:hypothetical protein
MSSQPEENQTVEVPSVSVEIPTVAVEVPSVVVEVPSVAVEVPSVAVEVPSVVSIGQQLIPKEVVEKLVVNVPEDIVKTANKEVGELSGIITVLVKNPRFVTRVEEGVRSILKDGKLDQNDIPELVFIIMESYNIISNVRVSYQELPDFIREVYRYIIRKLNIVPTENHEMFERMVMNSVKLVLLQPKVSAEISRSCGLC